MRSLSETAIRNPVFTWMIMAALIIFGAISFHRLGVSQLPDVDFPVISVSLSLNGAAPEIMEGQVLDPIEDAIMQIDGVRNVTSTAQQSSATISVEFELNQNIDEAMLQVQDRINQVSNLLPVNMFPAVLRKINPEDQPIMWMVLTSDEPNPRMIDMMIYARNYLYDQLGVVPGVGNIYLGGYVDPALRVWADIDKMNARELTADDILQAIVQEHFEIPAGAVDDGQKNHNLRVMGEAESPEEFSKIGINNRLLLGPNYRVTTIGDVAKVEEGIADVRKKSRFNGVRAVGLGIVKQHGSNAVEVADLVRAKVKEIQGHLPPHFHLDVRSDNTRFIKQSVDELLFTLLLSAILTSLVCYFFLGSWSSTLNVLMAIPTSIVGTFIAIFFCGYTLNTFTLLGLALAVGIVVDDAIMMLENIARHQELGQTKEEAALKGSKEIMFVAIAATAAVAAIFMPVVFMTGIIGRYFIQYGVTVTFAVLLSLLEALTLTPMRCSRFLKIQRHPRGVARFGEKLFVNLAEKYGRSLDYVLRHRWKTISIAVVFFIASLYLAKHLPEEMMPPQDQSQILMRFKLPVGSSIDLTDMKMRKVEDYLAKMPEVQGTYDAIGGFGGDAVNQANAFVILVDPGKRKLSQAQVMNKIRKDLPKIIPGVEIVVQDLSLRGFAATRGFPIEFVIQGPDWNKLTAVSQNVMDAMKKSGIATDVNTDVQAGMPEVEIIPERTKLAKYAVSLSTVTNDINALVGGLILTGQTEYTKGGHRYEIELRLVANQRNKVPDLDDVRFRNNRGEVEPLNWVTKREIRPSILLLTRLNRSRAITVYGNPGPGHSQQEALQKTESLAKSLLPPGYSMKMIGSSQSFRETFQSLVFALMLGILISYMVLGTQFNSFIHPITVLMALPFSFSGAFLGLALFHQSINMYSLIGLILLMGIVKKNSILLVDFTNRVRLEEKDVNKALIRACPVRLRPIVMTSLATVAGALPAALSIGPGAETRIPMSIAVIGGVIVSTFLTLFVVPCVYSLISRLERQRPGTVPVSEEKIPMPAVPATH